MQSIENGKAKGPSLSFLRNVGWSLFGQIAPLVAALISVPILVKHLGVDQLGLLTIAWMLIGYLSLFDLGIGRAPTQLLAQRIAQGCHRSVGLLLWTGTATMAVLGLVAMMVLGISAHWIVYSVLEIPSELRTETYWALLSLTPALPAVMLAVAFRGALEAKHASKLVSLVRIPLRVLMFVAPLCLPPLPNSLVGMFASLLAVRLLTCVAFWLCLRGGVPDALSYRFDRRLLPQLFRFGGWMTVTNTIGPFTVQMDRSVIGAMLPTAAVAYYSTPFEIVLKVLIIPDAVAGVYFSAFAKYFGERNFITADKLLKQSIVITAIVLGLVTVTALALAKIVLNIWMGEAFALHSISVMRMLIVGMLINRVGRIPFSFMQGIGKPKITAQSRLVELVIYAPLVIFLIEVHGIAGAAVAWTLRAAIGTTLLTGYSFFALRRARDGNFLQYGQKDQVIKTVAAIVVTYLPEKGHFQKLLFTLKGQVQKIIIVDNSPTDHVDHEMGGNIIFISNKSSIGLATVQNQGIERALSDGVTDVILFDQDSLSWSDMVHHLLQAQNVLVMQGLRVSSVGPATVDCRFGRRTSFFRLKGCPFERVATSPEGAPVPCIYTIASGQLINRNCLHSVGLIRNGFFVDYIDIEWGLRANQKGYPAYGIPAVIMQHRVGDNVIRVLTKEIPIHSPLCPYFMMRNAITLYRDKNVPFSWKAADVKSLAKKLLVTVFFGCNRSNHTKNIMGACKESILK